MIRLVLETVEETEEVGALLASSLLLPRGDDDSSSSSSSRHRLKGCVMCLDGDLGAGKTALARGFVRAATGDWDRRVTSPTYLLSNTYRIDERNVE
jgi:tRNA A37 threonylcarbamoyladenosine biosynthesis protein TsaE